MTNYGAGEDKPQSNGALVKIGLVVLALVAYFVWRAVSTAAGYGVFVVNGLHVPYDITIGELSLSLEPNSFQRVDLPTGQHSIVPSGAAGVQQVELNLDEPLTSRFFGAATVIVNPDGLAILVEEEIAYIEDGQPDYDEELDFEVHTGARQYRLDDIDFAFEEFPEHARLDSFEGPTFRRRLYLFEPTDVMDALDVLYRYADESTTGKYVGNYLTINPDDSRLVFMAGSLLPEPDYIEMLESRLHDRPIRVDWHRAYQNTMERAGRGPEVEDKYAGMLADEPEDPRLLYLAGRASSDTTRARSLFGEAESMRDGPIGYGYHALAYGDIASGRFDDAYDNANRALAAVPGHADFRNTYMNALQATGRWVELADLLEDKLTPLANQGANIAERFRFLVAAGHDDAATALADGFLAAFDEEYGEPESSEWRLYLAAIGSYVRAELSDYAAAITDLLGAEGEYRVAMLNGDIDRAVELSEELGFDDIASSLLMLSAALTADDTVVAQKYLSLSLERLAAGDADERVAAMLLENGANESAAFSELVMYPGRKRVFLVAMGLRHPKNRTAAFELAGRLNYAPTFPQHTLTRILSNGG